MNQRCRLCGEARPLLLSHILPSFVFKWQCESASGSLTSAKHRLGTRHIVPDSNYTWIDVTREDPPCYFSPVGGVYLAWLDRKVNPSTRKFRDAGYVKFVNNFCLVQLQANERLVDPHIPDGSVGLIQS